MTAPSKLSDVAKTIRSKNAGVDKITFDVIFPDKASYELVRRGGVLRAIPAMQNFGFWADR